ESYMPAWRGPRPFRAARDLPGDLSCTRPPPFGGRDGTREDGPRRPGTAPSPCPSGASPVFLDFPNLTAPFMRRYNGPASTIGYGWQYAAEKDLRCGRAPASDLLACA